MAKKNAPTEIVAGKIKQYLEKNPEIHQECCPLAILTWKTKYECKYYCPSTGLLRNNVQAAVNDPTYLLERYTPNITGAKNTIVGGYIHYDEETEVMMIAQVFMSGLRSKDGIKREWKTFYNAPDSTSFHGDKTKTYVFFLHGDKTPYNEDGTVADNWGSFTYYGTTAYMSRYSHIHSFVKSLFDTGVCDNVACVREINKFVDNEPVWTYSDHIEKITARWQISAFFSHKTYLKPKAKSSNGIDFEDLVIANANPDWNSGLMSKQGAKEAIHLPDEHDYRCAKYKISHIVKTNDGILIYQKSLVAHLDEEAYHQSKAWKDYQSSGRTYYSYHHPEYVAAQNYANEHCWRDYIADDVCIVITPNDKYRVFTRSLYALWSDNKERYVSKWSEDRKPNYLNDINDTSLTEEQFKELCRIWPKARYLQNYKERKLLNILQYLKNEFLESLFKIKGCEKLCEQLAQNNEFHANEKKMFVTVNESGKTLVERYGFSIKQLQCISKYLEAGNWNIYSWHWTRHNMINDIRQICLMDGVQPNSLDDDTFDKYLNVMQALRSADNYIDILSFINSIKTDGQTTSDVIKKLIKLPNIRQSISILRDCVNMYNKLDILDRQNFEIKWKNDEELHRVHDQLVQLMQAKEIRDNAEKYERMQKIDAIRGKKYCNNFGLNDDNFKFFIRLPKTTTEIVQEGNTLHHCVGGYADRHAAGSTTIMFLRKKDEPNVPFYTIEIDNGKNVVQIHGFGNRWLGNNPEAIPTVVAWIKKTGIVCDNYKILNTSTGYGRCAGDLNAADFGLV